LRALERGTKPSRRQPRDNEASAGEAGGEDGAATAARPSDVLFRISSLEPMDCSREIVDLVATSDRFAPHFHLPLQHASDRLLSAMRRPYTLAQYASLVDDIRARITHASIGSDIIIGFPGETDVDFDRLATYLERSPLTHLHVFPYSDRPGTPASTMHEKVPGGVVRERARHVREIGQRLAERFRDAQIGTTHRALTLEDGSLAVTGNYLKVRIPAGRARNEWVQLRMTSHHDGELLGS
jgi:threonylcarbamoyladenosine tRNA methylthiotransferase MtaB